MTKELLDPLKTSENLWFFDVFRRYSKRPVAWNGLNDFELRVPVKLIILSIYTYVAGMTLMEFVEKFLGKMWHFLANATDISMCDRFNRWQVLYEKTVLKSVIKVITNNYYWVINLLANNLCGIKFSRIPNISKNLTFLRCHLGQIWITYINLHFTQVIMR